MIRPATSQLLFMFLSQHALGEMLVWCLRWFRVHTLDLCDACGDDVLQ